MASSFMISIKGIRQGLLVVLEDGTAGWDDHIAALERKIGASASFFKGGTVALDVRSHAATPEQIEHVRALLHSFDVSLWAVLSSDPTTQASTRRLGLHSEIPQPAARPAEPAVSETTAEGAPQPIEAELMAVPHGLDAGDGILLRSRLRSGMVVRHPGHILVIGDVNPGSRLIAGGDIIVWGKLQGDVHAGALGDERARICALALSTQVLRIADVTSRYVPGKQGRHARPEVAVLSQKEITVSEWTP